MAERVDDVIERLVSVESKVELLGTSVKSVESQVDRLETRVESVERTVDSLESKVDLLASTVDERFAEVAEAFVEQRRYTDFAFERLDASMTSLDGRMATLETAMHSGFARLDRKLDQLIDRA